MLLYSKVTEVPRAHADPGFVKNCTFNAERRRVFFELLKEWMRVSAELDIPWFITDGTLLGSHR